MIAPLLRPWVCKNCGTIVRAATWPEPITWTDGHRCEFVTPEEWERLRSERKGEESPFLNSAPREARP